jgi:hypothetical protein
MGGSYGSGSTAFVQGAIVTPRVPLLPLFRCFHVQMVSVVCVALVWKGLLDGWLYIDLKLAIPKPWRKPDDTTEIATVLESRKLP